MKEQWRFIKGFEYRYSVSTLGRVRAETRICFNNRYGYYTLKPKLLKPCLNNKSYLTVTLAKNGRSFPRLVHRLVAEAFLLNPDNKPQINHIDGDRTNNNVDNLEWCSQSENNLHSYKELGRIKIGLKGKKSTLSKIVLQIKDNNIIAEFYGTYEAERKTGIARQSIGKVANGKLKQAGGYRWIWKTV